MRKIIPIFISCMFLTLLFSNISESDNIPTTDDGQIQITKYDSDQKFPVIYEDKIAWKDYRHNVDGKCTYDEDDIIDIYLYDIPTEKETQIASNNLSKSILGFHDNNLYWSEKNGNLTYIYQYNFQEGIKSNNKTFENRHQLLLFEGQILSVDHDWLNRSLYVYDLISYKEDILLSEFDSKQLEGFNGNYILYSDVPKLPTFFNLFLYEVSTEMNTQLTFNWSTSYEVEMFDMDIIYEENNVVYLYDISNGKTKIIQETGLTDIKLHKKTVIGVDWIDDKAAIHAIDYSVNKDIRFTTMDTSRFGYDYGLDIYNNIVVWSDNWDGEAPYEIGEYDNIFIYNINGFLNEEKDKNINDTFIPSFELVIIICAIGICIILFYKRKVFRSKK